MFPHGSALPELKMGHDLNKERVLIQDRDRDRGSHRDADITTAVCGALSWGKKVFSQPPIVQVLPLKKMREA
ncbi:hypothetical protein QTP86_034731 [Hemibagrus guttatus]|nr:hypothetical protein QTP86_034731 [Hemibagrus guttatus]